MQWGVCSARWLHEVHASLWTPGGPDLHLQQHIWQLRRKVQTVVAWAHLQQSHLAAQAQGAINWAHFSAEHPWYDRGV